MSFLSRFSPIRAYQDLRFFLAQRRPFELVFFALAAGVTGFFVYAFALNDYVPPPYVPNIVYVQQWPMDRTDTEIRAAQKVDQAAKEKRQAAEKVELAKRRATFQKLDDQMTKWGL